MRDIYYNNNYFDRRDIYNKIARLDNKINNERNKPADERDKELEFNLLYARFLQGLKLSTGSIIY